MTDTRAPAAYDGSGPSSPQWWPSRYGADDELGAGHELTPERTLAALRIPTQGRIIELAQLLEPGIPAYPPRRVAPAAPGPQHARGAHQLRGHVTRPSVDRGARHVVVPDRLPSRRARPRRRRRAVLQRPALRRDLHADRPDAARDRARAAVGDARRLPRHRRAGGHDDARGGLRDHARAPRGGLRAAGRRDRRRRRRAAPHRLVGAVDGRQRALRGARARASAGTPRTG